MPDLITAREILDACKAARRAGQYIEVDFMLPSILYYRDDDNQFHFQEESAHELFDLYRATAEQTGVALRDVLLWAAQTWDLDGDRLILRG